MDIFKDTWYLCFCKILVNVHHCCKSFYKIYLSNDTSFAVANNCFVIYSSFMFTDSPSKRPCPDSVTITTKGI